MSLPPTRRTRAPRTGVRTRNAARPTAAERERTEAVPTRTRWDAEDVGGPFATDSPRIAHAPPPTPRPAGYARKAVPTLRTTTASEGRCRAPTGGKRPRARPAAPSRVGASGRHALRVGHPSRQAAPNARRRVLRTETSAPGGVPVTVSRPIRPAVRSVRCGVLRRMLRTETSAPHRVVASRAPRSVRRLMLRMESSDPRGATATALPLGRQEVLRVGRRGRRLMLPMESSALRRVAARGLPHGRAAASRAPCPALRRMRRTESAAPYDPVPARRRRPVARGGPYGTASTTTPPRRRVDAGSRGTRPAARVWSRARHGLPPPGAVTPSRRVRTGA